MTMTEKFPVPTPADIIRGRNKASQADKPEGYVDFFTAPFVEKASEATLGTDVLEQPVDVSQESLKETAKTAFNEVYSEMEDVSRQRQALFDQDEILRNKFVGLENVATQLAAAAGSEYLPNSVVAKDVIETGIDVVEVTPGAKQQNHLPSSADQVFIEAIRTQDSISAKAFSNTAPDERKYRRASSYDPAEAVAVAMDAKPVTAVSEPVVKAEASSQPKGSDAEVEDAIEEAQARGFATFEEYIAHTKKEGPVEGLYESGNRHYNAMTGKRVSKQAFEDYRDAPVASTAHYFDEQNGIDNKNKLVEGPDYTGMTIVELAREAGKVKYVNPGDEKNIDPELMKIRDIAKAKYFEMAKLSGDKDAVAHYEESMEDFDSMSGRYADTLYDKEVRVELEQTSLKEKAKAWWGKNKEKFGVVYWAAKWNTTHDKYLDRGVNENMSDVEIDKVRNKNRTKLSLASTGLALVTGITVGIGLQPDWPQQESQGYINSLRSQ